MFQDCRVDIRNSSIALIVSLLVYVPGCLTTELEVGTSSEYVIGCNLSGDCTGTSEDDEIIGNSDDNTIVGLDGDDICIGGLGADTIDGGNGEDQVSYAFSTEGVMIDLADGMPEQGGEAAGDNLISIENVRGSSHNDIVSGNSDPNDFLGAGGDDVLMGEGNDDYLLGGEGNDELYGGPDDDVLNGGPGVDYLDGGDGEDTYDCSGSSDSFLIDLTPGQLYARNLTVNEDDALWNIENVTSGAGDDTIRGDAQVNELNGGSGDDHIYGEGGNDMLFGGAGGDTIDGGDGIDYVSYANSPAKVVVKLAPVFPESCCSGGHADNDELVSIENIRGSNHSDELFGDDNANVILGANGIDIINGHGGDDYLHGGAGDDYFRFTGMHGTDTLPGFMAGAGSEDKLDLSSYGYTGMSDPSIQYAQQGSYGLIIHNGGIIKLQNVNVPGDLDEDDFIF